MMPLFAKDAQHPAASMATVTACAAAAGNEDGEEAGFEIEASPEVLAAGTPATSSSKATFSSTIPNKFSRHTKRRPKFILVGSIGVVLIVAIVLLATLLPSGGSTGNNDSTNSSREAVSSSSSQHAEESNQTTSGGGSSGSATSSSIDGAEPPRWNTLQDLSMLTFLDEQNVQRNCTWLRDQIMVDFDATISTYCHPPVGVPLPLSAVICPATCLRMAPTECEDSTALVEADGEQRECSWFGEDEARTSEYCSNNSTDWAISTTIDAACPETCGKCFNASMIPSPEENAETMTSTPLTNTCPSIPYTSHDEDDSITFERDDKPDRTFRIYTPDNFDPNQPNKVVFIYHGWTTGTFCRGRNFLNSNWRDLADEHGYVLVAVDGLAENNNDAPRSFSFPGSSDGLGRDGQTPSTCNTQQRGPDFCYPSCERQGKCNNRCGWTHCLDDDVQMFVDLVDEVANKYVCIDRSRIYVFGYSMGGMFAWSLAQDPRSSPLIAGIGAAMGLPMHDHLVGKGTSSNLPAIGIYGDRDCTVPPGDGTEVYTEGCDGDGYRYVDAFRQHKLWAEEHGCSVGETHPARFEYIVDGRNEVRCASHCDPTLNPPMSVDCRNNAPHGKQFWHLDIALKFFEDHWQRKSR